MFSSDKDLRKVTRPTANGAGSRSVPASGGRAAAGAGVLSSTTAGGSSSSSTSTLGKEEVDIVALARQEREQRQRTRELTGHALLIQRWMRGRVAARRVVKQERGKFDSKMADVVKISQVVEKASGSKFVPPPATCIELCARSCFQGFYPSFGDSERVLLLCSNVMIPSLSQADANKNLAASMSNHATLLARTAQCLFGALRARIAKSHKSRTTAPDSGTESIILAVCLLLGARVLPPSISAPSPDAELLACFSAIRSRLLAGLSITNANATVAVTATSSFGLLRELRSLLVLQAAPYLEQTEPDLDPTAASTARAATARQATETSAALLLRLSLFLLDCQPQSRQRAAFLQAFCREILSAPLLLALLPVQSLVNLMASAHISEILACVRDLSAAMDGSWPPSPHDVLLTGHFVLGNICSLSAVLRVMPNQSPPRPGAATDDGTAPPSPPPSSAPAALLIQYLRLAVRLLRAFYLPGIFQGKAGILWSRAGASITATGLPLLLQKQLLSILDVRLQHELYSRTLLPLRDDVSNMARPDDQREVVDALASTALDLTRATLKEQIKETSGGFFSGRWATTLMRSVGASLGLTSGGGASSTLSGAAGKAEQQAATAAAAEISASQVFAASILPPSPFAYDADLVSSVAELWSLVLPMAANRTNAKADSQPWQAISALAFGTRAVDRLWAALAHLHRGDNFEKLASRLHVGGEGGGLSSAERDPTHLLVACCALLRVQLQALDDSELYDQGLPLPLHQVLRLVRMLKEVLFKLLQHNPEALIEPPPPSPASPYDPAGMGAVAAGGASSSSSSSLAQRMFVYGAVKTFETVLADLYTRWARRPFCRPSTWEVAHCESSTMRRALREPSSGLGSTILRVMPWAVSFHERLKIFREVLEAERVAIQGPEDHRAKGLVIRVRRGAILEDGLKAFDSSAVGMGIKQRIQVRYINAFGEEEAGIDVGGLFKDFVTDLSQRVFDPSYGLFSLTTQNFIYPNPSAVKLYDEREIDHLFSFIGRVLGKALFENITLQPQFAHFFLAFMHGRYNFANLINDLSTLDAELFRNLMFLKSYQGDIADLSLTFSVGDASLGERDCEVDLFPGGSRIAVTSHNRHRYIHAMAKYYLHDRLRQQAAAFFQGLYSVISPGLLSIFCAPELQVVISGSVQGVSLEDLRSNTRYAGGYFPGDRTMANFWGLLEELSEQDRAKLVRFVTSCERPPSLGFAALHPPFTIQRVEGGDERLPTASTCFNILKLPVYSSKAKLREKLLMSIRSGAGFDLS